MSSENFIARYHPYAQYHLSLHHDASQITTVVTLNEDFEGGGTYFPNQNSKLKGKKDDISIHPGQIFRLLQWPLSLEQPARIPQ